MEGNGRCVWRWVDAENVPIRTMKVSRKRAKIGARTFSSRTTDSASDAGDLRLAATPHPLFLQRTQVSRKRAKIGARAGPIWHYVALRGTTWHKAPPTCTRTCAFEGPLGSPRRAIQRGCALADLDAWCTLARQRLAATPHPLFLQRTLVSRKRAKIGVRAGPIWHPFGREGTQPPTTYIVGVDLVPRSANLRPANAAWRRVLSRFLAALLPSDS